MGLVLIVSDRSGLDFSDGSSFLTSMNENTA